MERFSINKIIEQGRRPNKNQRSPPFLFLLLRQSFPNRGGGAEMESSILESIGVEIIGVMLPVSICMFLVVLLVYTLSSPSSSSSSSIRTAANLVYLENPTDSTSQKLEGALLNALVFIIIISLVTFLLFLLYYYNFTNFLKHYMRFSSFFVLATMGGPIFLSLIQHFNIPVDSVTCFLLLFNFTLVGVLSIFASGFPIILRQSYMVCLGIIVAAWLTKLPEWTTWVLLVALALYDLVAVLAPVGPLKLLVDLAATRDEEQLPALVYEARPTVPRNPSSPPFLVAGYSDSTAGSSIELQAVHNVGGSGRNGGHDEGYRSFLVGDSDASSNGDSFDSVVPDRARHIGGGSGGSEIEGDEEEMSPLVVGSGNEREEIRRNAVEMFSRGIKLGLGDFIFYSVLVGRAAMYDLMTVYACYLAIISGLGCTLILLSVCRQALPALPISIVLGIIFYFLTRLLMEPFVAGTSTNLLMF